MMRWIYKLPLRLRSIFHKTRVEDDLSEELRFHLEKQIEQNIAKGMSTKEARYAALRTFGGVEQVKEECRDSWGVRAINELAQDIRYGLRQLRRNPGFTAVAVLSLALGIGVNTTVFSIVDSAFLRSWPVENPGALVSIFTSTKRTPQDQASYAEYLDLLNQNTAFSGVLAYGYKGAFVNVNGRDEFAKVSVASPNYFSVLGVKAALGRTFFQETNGSANEMGVVISYELWQGLFGGNSNWVGKAIQLDDKTFTLLGIAPREFRGLTNLFSTDVWMTPAVWSAMVPGSAQEFEARADRWFTVVGRLRPGMTVAQARSQANTIAGRLALAYPASDKGRKFVLESQWDRTRNTLPLVMLVLSLAGFVLLIACANVAGLLLARHERRRSEIGVRLALGAGRRRLIAQMLVESGVLAFLGGAIGTAIAWWLIRLMPSLVSTAQLGVHVDVRLDLAVLTFAVAASAIAALAFGLAPAFHGTRCDLVPILKGEALEHGRRKGTPGLRQVLVAGEIALAMTLMVGSALLFRSLLKTMAVPPGFDTRKKVVILTMAPPELYGYNKSQSMALYQSLAERLQTLPGVRRASYARRPPLANYERGEMKKVFVPGSPLNEAGKAILIRFNIISPGFFPTLGTRIVQERGFEESDGPNSTKIILVNQTMARRFWPHADAVGQWIDVEKTHYQVVGVVEDGKYLSLHEAPEPYMFFPFAQTFSFEASIFVETASYAPTLMKSVLSTARSVSPKVPITSAVTLRSYMGSFLFADRAEALLAAVLGLLGIFLAAVGLYGVVSYYAGRRTHEIGIRIALGARPEDVTRLVLGQSAKLVVAGVATGLGCALGVGHLMSDYLYGVKPTDLPSFAAAALLVSAVALSASYIPARRASKVDSMVALHYE